LQDLGLTVQVETVQKSLLLEQTAKSQAMFFRASWIADYPTRRISQRILFGNPRPRIIPLRNSPSPRRDNRRSSLPGRTWLGLGGLFQQQAFLAPSLPAQ